MASRILLLAIIVLAFSCQNNHGQEKPEQETPKALEDNQSSFEVVSKRGPEDLVEELYRELLTKDQELKSLEQDIQALSNSKDDSTRQFTNYNGKSKSYFNSAEQHMLEISDSVLKEKINSIVSAQLGKYNLLTSKHKGLLEAIQDREMKISDLHQVLKILRTLPMIEKYQKDNLPGTKPLEGYIKQQERVIKFADTLIKK